MQSSPTNLYISTGIDKLISSFIFALTESSKYILLSLFLWLYFQLNSHIILKILFIKLIKSFNIID